MRALCARARSARGAVLNRSRSQFGSQTASATGGTASGSSGVLEWQPYHIDMGSERSEQNSEGGKKGKKGERKKKEKRGGEEEEGTLPACPHSFFVRRVSAQCVNRGRGRARARQRAREETRHLAPPLAPTARAASPRVPHAAGAAPTSHDSGGRCSSGGGGCLPSASQPAPRPRRGVRARFG
jgi:hypothetical protein